MGRTRFAIRLLPILLIFFGEGSAVSAKDTPNAWQERVLAVPYGTEQRRPLLQLIRQDYQELEGNRSCIKTPLIIGKRHFEHGLGTHSISHIRVSSPQPIRRFSAWVGVDNNDRTQGANGSVVFSVEADGRELYRSDVLREGQEAQRVDLDTNGAKTLDLHVGDGGDGPAFDHADWAEAALTLQDGTTMRLDTLEQGAPGQEARYPFSFVY